MGGEHLNPQESATKQANREKEEKAIQTFQRLVRANVALSFSASMGSTSVFTVANPSPQKN